MALALCMSALTDERVAVIAAPAALAGRLVDALRESEELLGEWTGLLDLGPDGFLMSARVLEIDAARSSVIGGDLVALVRPEDADIVSVALGLPSPDSDREVMRLVNDPHGPAVVPAICQEALARVARQDPELIRQIEAWLDEDQAPE